MQKASLRIFGWENQRFANKAYQSDQQQRKTVKKYFDKVPGVHAQFSKSHRAVSQKDSSKDSAGGSSTVYESSSVFMT